MAKIRSVRGTRHRPSVYFASFATGLLPLLALAALCSLALWVPLVRGNGLTRVRGEALLLLLELMLIHSAGALLLAAALAAAAVPLRWRGTTLRRAALGGGIGALVALNTVLRFPATYGFLNTKGQAFVHPLGLLGLAVSLAAVPALIHAATAPRRRTVLAAWLAVYLLHFGLHLAAERDPETDLSWLPPSTPRVAAAVEPPARVLLIGADGLSWNALRVLLEAGELPAVRNLIRGGAAGPLATLSPSKSPVVWTTVATGRLPAEHGILSFSKFFLPGIATPIRDAPRLGFMNWWNGVNRVLLAARRPGWVGQERFSSLDRRVPALWEVADAYGVSTGVFAWWASGPVAAPASGGFRVSSFKGTPGSLAPAEIRPLLDTKRPLPEGWRDAAGIHRDAAAWWRIEHRRVAMFVRLLERFEPRLALVYLSAADVAQHFAWRGDRLLVPSDPWNVERLTPTVAASYRLLDRWLAELVTAGGEKTTVLVVSDHGFRFDGQQHHRAPPGVLLAAGTGIRPGARPTGASIVDVFPTVAAALGLPLEADLPGRVLGELFAPGALRPTETVDAYPPRPQPLRAAPDPEVEADHLRRLRALGYFD